MSVVVKKNSSLECLVTLTGAPSNLDADDITAKATLQDGKATVTSLTATIAIVSTTSFTATFAKDVFTPGKWLFRARNSPGSESQGNVESLIQIENTEV